MLSTQRCLLREVEPSDVAALAQLWVDKDVRRYLGGTLPIEEAIARSTPLIDRPTTWSVCRLRDTAVIGMASLSPRDARTELSYMFLPEYWGHGYALEACRAVLEFALADLRLDEVIAITQTSNLRSCRLLQALGMEPCRTFTEFDAEQVEYVCRQAHWSAGFSRHAD